jgi:hypothetical protein
MELQIFKQNSEKIINIANNIIRKHSNTGNVVEDFLSSFTIPDTIRGQACLSIIKHLKEKSYFDVCCLNYMAKTNGVSFSREHSSFFSSLHCVDWIDMTSDVKDYLLALIIKYFEKQIEKSGM